MILAKGCSWEKEKAAQEPNKEMLYFQHSSPMNFKKMPRLEMCTR